MIGALVLVSQGVIQNLSPFVDVMTLEGGAQRVPMAPVASQEIIKEFGTNGGGFFNANSSHPFGNPSPLTNLIEMAAIFAIPAGLTYTFGLMAGDRRQGWALFAVMSVLFLIGAAVTYAAEAAESPVVNGAGIGLSPNMEGKEVRFGVALSSLLAFITTAASCGAVNSFYDSFTPLGGLVPLVISQLGEIIVKHSCLHGPGKRG